MRPRTDGDTLITMTDEICVTSSSPTKKNLLRQRRTAFLSIAASVAVVICIFFAASTQHRKSALTDKGYTFARELVRSEIRQKGAVLV